MTRHTSGQTKRGIDSIAHLFLSQSGQADSAQPLRRPPATRQVEPLRAELVLAYHLDEPLKQAQCYADYMRQHGRNVTLVDIDNTEAKIVSLEPNPENNEYAAEVIGETEDLTGALLPVLTEMVRNCDNLLLNIAPSFSNRIAELIEHCRQLTVLCSCRGQGAVAAYKVMKIISEHLKPDHELSLFVCDAPDSDTADEVYYKIAGTAKDFLDKVIIPAGCSVCKDKAIADNEIMKEFDFENMPDSDPTISADDNYAYDNDTNTLVAGPMTFAPVKVDDLPRTDARLSDVLQLALPGWLTTVPAAMVVPLRLPDSLDPASKVLIDATGGLHVLTVSLNTNNNIFSRALQVRKWLCDHLPLVTANCRQLRTDPAAPTGIIMVAPDVTESLRQAYLQITDFPCRIMQLMFLKNGCDNSLLIIPAKQ